MLFSSHPAPPGPHPVHHRPLDLVPGVQAQQPRHGHPRRHLDRRPRRRHRRAALRAQPQRRPAAAGAGGQDAEEQS